jgi:DNA excision repair protein ERCC-2
MTLTLRCLDPSILTQDVFASMHANILMSGTLEPLNMYKDILGIPQGETLQLSSPFAKENRLTIIDTATTTQYRQRNPSMYTEISSRLTTLVNAIKGNVIVFFPSYAMRDSLYPKIKTPKQIFLEKQGTTKTQKKQLLKDFTIHKNEGAVLLATSSGNFGEGIDLPGDHLQGVIIVGLPLQPPDLETEELIKYYDHKFNKGKLYGYIFPTFMRIIQNAGRLIRTEKDRGVIVFMDNRYTWPTYKQCFPADYDLIIGKTEDYEEKIKKFFSTTTKPA